MSSFQADLVVNHKPYKLRHCSYNFQQDLRADGKPSSYVKGGLILLTFAEPASKEIIEWMLGPIGKNSGAIRFYEVNGLSGTHQLVEFRDGYCIGFTHTFHGERFMPGTLESTITIRAETITIDHIGIGKTGAGVGDYTAITAIEILPHYKKVYNFDIADNAKYFVADDGVLVHNGYGGKGTKGGAHENLDFDNATEQRHHMPSQAAGNKGGEGGAITMETVDHKSAASSDNQPGSREYRQQQKDLIDNDNFEEAFKMDVKDIQLKFGDKYNEAIEQLREWYKSQGKF